MSLAVLFGLTCTALNVWLLHKERLNRHHQEAAPAAVVLETDDTVQPSAADQQRPRSKISTNGKAVNLSFDNPNWVYGTTEAQIPAVTQQQSDGAHHPANETTKAHPADPGATMMRYATIRRATIASSIQPTDKPNPSRRLNKSASFRVESDQLRPGPVASVHRSKTMRETTASSTFAQRFQPGGSSEGPSALSFIHDAIADESRPKTHQVETPVAQPTKDESPSTAAPPLPPPRPVIRPPLTSRTQNVRSSDRIVLRVESFRGAPGQQQPGRNLVRTGRPAGRNAVKRVSSSTQTDLLIISKSAAQRNKQRPAAAGLKYSGPSLVVTNSEDQQLSVAGGGQPAQLSPVDSSSGYSSPRGTTDESKSPSPEPAATASNITVIHIEPPPSTFRHPSESKEEDTPDRRRERIVEATYAVPRKRSERNSTTSPISPPATTSGQNFRVSIQKTLPTKPAAALSINRSVSFHQMSQSDRRAVYSQEWLGMQTASPLPVTIPRPALRMTPSPNHYQHPRYITSPSPTSSATSSVTTGRRSSNLSRSTSMYLAMSEIQRKLDILQVLSNNSRVQQPPPPHMMPGVHQADADYSVYYTAAAAAYPPHRPSSSKRSNSSRSAAAPTCWSSDSMETLAYLSELEQLARHWRTQLLYKVSNQLNHNSIISSNDFLFFLSMLTRWR